MSQQKSVLLVERKGDIVKVLRDGGFIDVFLDVVSCSSLKGAADLLQDGPLVFDLVLVDARLVARDEDAKIFETSIVPTAKTLVTLCQNPDKGLLIRRLGCLSTLLPDDLNTMTISRLLKLSPAESR